MNNNDVIEYVRTTSNHPHAEKIIEWVLTGCIVKYWHDHDNEWKETTTPGWDKDTKYLLFKPKPAKPAYRVYMENNYERPLTVMKETYEKHRNNYDGKVKWISDWIEYDPPKKWPTPLVERIAAIDIKAAEWIVEHWDDLSTDEYNFEGRYSRESEKLKTMFSWGQSGIDNHIWYRISEKLGE